MRQEPHRLSDLEWTLEHVRPSLDTYASQGIFTAPNRRALNIGWMTHAYLDLDIYRVPDLAGRSPDQIAWLILQYCRENGLHRPSLIEFSGRGIYLKWLWKAPIPKPAASKAVAVNRALVQRFASFGADPKCVDVSRILRVIGTVNSKSGEIVRIVWPHPGASVETYDFELFADEVLQYTAEQIRGFRARCATVVDLGHHHRLERTRAYREQNPGRQCWPDFYWKRLCDLEILARMRFPDGIVQPGERDLYGFLGICHLALARVVPADSLWPEAVTWARKLLPEDYVSGEYRQHASSALDRARRAAAGETVVFGRCRVTPAYTYSTARMIDLLEVTPEDMREMHTLIDKQEKARRRREREGRMERARYEGRARALHTTVAAALKAGTSPAQVVADHGISLRHVYRLAQTACHPK